MINYQRECVREYNGVKVVNDVERKIFLKQISRSPLRYGVYGGSLADAGGSGKRASLSKRELLLSIGYQSLRQFFSEDILNQFFRAQELWLTIDYKKLYNLELKNLKKEAFHYLAKAEKSPLAFENWLRKRFVLGELQEALLSEAIENTFLSGERFAALYVKKRFHQATRPWWRTAAELGHLGIDSELSKALRYDDLDMLKNYWFIRHSSEYQIYGKKLEPYFGAGKRPRHAFGEEEHSSSSSNNDNDDDDDSLTPVEKKAIAKVMKKFISRGFSYDTVKALLQEIEAALREKRVF